MLYMSNEVYVAETKRHYNQIITFIEHDTFNHIINMFCVNLLFTLLVVFIRIYFLELFGKATAAVLNFTCSYELIIVSAPVWHRDINNKNIRKIISHYQLIF